MFHSLAKCSEAGFDVKYSEAIALITTLVQDGKLRQSAYNIHRLGCDLQTTCFKETVCKLRRAVITVFEVSSSQILGFKLQNVLILM